MFLIHAKLNCLFWFDPKEVVLIEPDPAGEAFVLHLRSEVSVVVKWKASLEALVDRILSRLDHQIQVEKIMEIHFVIRRNDFPWYWNPNLKAWDTQPFYFSTAAEAQELAADLDLKLKVGL